MNRKQTILIAVVVNAGLLMILLITALTTPEEILQAPSSQIAEPLPPQELHLDIPKPLFTEALDQTLRQSIEPEKKLPIAIEAPILHPLPDRTTETPLPPAPLAETPRLAPPPQADHLEIVVKKGDSLEKLAKQHHTSVSELIKVNRLPSSFLRVGQQLKIPTKKNTPPPATPSPVTKGDEYYTIKVGDNPWSIALKHHMKVEELLRLNALNEEKARKLKPGDRLRIKR
ncbi:MAG: LysM peptidoglycan-binding domain-containing protein [Chlamydiales bacterium]|nr:LysM peptidoglycan-binding domain-containing protein [Chlamydiales bacterium]